LRLLGKQDFLGFRLNPADWHYIALTHVKRTWLWISSAVMAGFFWQ
jgi:hypothetical protein